LDLVHRTSGGSGHRPSSGTNYGTHRTSDNRAGGGADGRAGGLLARGAGACQETQSRHEHEFLHDLPPTDPIPGYPNNSGKAGQFSDLTKKVGKDPEHHQVFRSKETATGSEAISGKAAGEPALDCRT